MRLARAARAALALGPLLLIIVLSGALAAPSVGLAKTQPLCTDVGQTPVLKDANWSRQGTNVGYYDYATKFDGIFVMKQESQFVAYVRIDTNGTVSSIYRAVSRDGALWNITKTPVLSTGPPGSWDSTLVFYPDVVWNGTGYMMYYDGNGAYNKTTFPANFRQIGVAFSSDGVAWTKYSDNPVITHGPGAYDSRFTRFPSVIYDNGTYKMWYFGTPSPTPGTNYLSNIDYATSKDGVHWTKYAGNPVFTGFSLSGTFVAHSPSAVKENGTYLMAFSDGVADLGYATSSDGVGWSFNNSTNVLVSLSGWHNGYVDFPSLVVSGNRLLLWFYGADNSNQSSPYTAGIGFATCGLALASATTSTTTVVRSTVSTSISTSIVNSMVTSTVVAIQNAPTYQLATAGAIGFAAAAALSVVLIATRLKMRRRA